MTQNQFSYLLVLSLLNEAFIHFKINFETSHPAVYF